MTLLAVLICLFLFLKFICPIILGTIFVHQSVYTRINPEFESISAENLPPKLRHSFQRTFRVLEDRGFVVVDYLYQSEYTKNVTSYVVLLKNSMAGESAFLADLHVKVKDVYKNVAYLEFVTEFSNGFVIGTSNSSQPHIFKSDPQHKIFKFPKVQDPSRLYEVHRRLVQKHNVRAARYVPSDGREVAHFSSSMTKSMKKQVELGYYYADEKAGVFRKTWKGAFVFTCLLSSPLKQARRAALASKANRLLAYLEM